MAARTGLGLLGAILTVTLLVRGAPVVADIILVPEDFPTIQEGIDAAADGDEVVVAPDVWFERIDFLDKDIVVRGTDPADPDVVDATIIDGSSAGTVVTLSRGVLDGFTVRNGLAEFGGGVRAIGSAQLRRNSFVASIASNGGGAIFADGDILIERNRFTGNSAFHGGAVQAQTRVLVVRNLFADNTAGRGGAVYALHNCSVRENAIVGNRAGDGGGVFVRHNAAVRSNLIAGNQGSSDGGGVFAGLFETYSGTVAGNTLIGNLGSDGSGVHLAGGVVASNIFAFSPSGSDVIAGFPQPRADYNCVHGNAGPTGVSGPNDVLDGPGFVPGPAGTWTSEALFDEESGMTTLTDANAAFAAEALVGGLVDPDTGDGRRFAIVDNTTTTINVAGDACLFNEQQQRCTLAEPGDGYQVFDFHLGGGSPCIGAGDPGRPLACYEGVDLDGDPRLQGCAPEIGADEVPGTPTSVLVVDSTMTTPVIAVSIDDCRGLGAGADRFNRFYDGAPVVTLTAEEQFPGLPFRWVVDGDERPFGEFEVAVDLSEHVDVIANYFPVVNVTRNAFFTSIQEAVGDFGTFDGHEIVVYPSVYFENVDFLGKMLEVRSLDPMDPTIVAQTVVDGGGSDTVVTLSAGSVSGFTIRNGSENTGGGVSVSGPAVVRLNVITGNGSSNLGAGVYAFGDAVVEFNTITGNSGSTGSGVSAQERSVVRGNVITANTTGQDGGGVEADDDAVVEDNVITGNEARSGGGVFGTGNAIVRRNDISGNVAMNRGGGVYSTGDARFENNTIVGNESRDVENGGGGAYLFGRALIVDSVIIGNTSLGPGGGIHLNFGADAIGNTIVDNTCVTNGAGIFANGLHEQFFVAQNVVAFNAGRFGIYSDEPISIDYNCVFGNGSGGYGGLASPGPHDLTVDPLLEPDRLHLTLESPCINAGDPSFLGRQDQTDIDGDPRVLSGRVDVGADEFRCPADLDIDGYVDFADLLAVLSAWGDCPSKQACPADVDGSGTVDFGDVLIVLSSWGACP